MTKAAFINGIIASLKSLKKRNNKSPNIIKTNNPNKDKSDFIKSIISLAIIAGPPRKRVPKSLLLDITDLISATIFFSFS